MSFGSSSNLPQQPPDLMGAQNNLVASNQQAIPLPWFSGTRWVSVHWLSDAFNVRTTEIRQKVGKSSQVTGYNYFACFAALVSNGLVDRITAIRFNDTTVWSAYPGGLVRDPLVNGGDYVDITIVGRGIIRLYWGTETQGIDALLASSVPSGEAATAAQTAYRGQCYIVGNDILFGAGVTTAPNIVLEVSRTGHPPAYICADPKIVPAGSDGIRYSANPVAVIWEWWTDPRFGMGRPESDLDIPRLKAASDVLATELVGVSPYVDTQNDVKTNLVLLFEYFDMYPTSYGGKFGVELVRPGASSVDVGEGVIGDVSFDGQQWPDTYNVTRVTFADYQLYGQGNTATYREQANFAITGKPKPQTLDRPWLTAFSSALRVAGAAGRYAGVPNIKGSLSILESEAAGIQVGSVFNLSTRDGQALRLRCTQRSEPPHDSRAVGITFEEDRGWANALFFDPAQSARQARPQLSPTPLAAAIVDAPFAFSPDPLLPAVMLFTAREDKYTNGFDVWRSPDDAAYVSAAATLHKGELYKSFAVKASLRVEYPDSTGLVDGTVGVSLAVTSADDELLLGEWDLAAGLNHDLLAFFGDSADEIMSLYDVTKVAGGYTAHTVRALYDTLRRTHALGKVVWIQAREKVVAETWPPYSTEPRYFKFQPFFGSSGTELSDITPIVHTENARSLLPLPPAALKVSADPAAPVWTPGGPDLPVTWVNSARARTVFGLPLNEAQPSDLDHVKMVLTDRDSLFEYGTVLHAADGESLTIANSYVVGLGLGSFKLHVYGVRNSWVSLDSVDLLVTSTSSLFISGGAVLLQSTDLNWYWMRCELSEGEYRLDPDQSPSPAPPAGSLGYAAIDSGSGVFKLSLSTFEGTTTVSVAQETTLATPVLLAPLLAGDATLHKVTLSVFEGTVDYEVEPL